MRARNVCSAAGIGVVVALTIVVLGAEASSYNRSDLVARYSRSGSVAGGFSREIAWLDAPHLAKQHAGWRKVQCFECHDAEEMAQHHADAATLKVTDCGPCHGFNGAPHEPHAIKTNPCASCHQTTEHLKSFEVPGDCMKCHQHPESPKGK